MVSDTKKNKVWEKAKPVRGKNPDTWRRDAKGNIIRRGSYGTQGQYAWEVDHIYPESKGGSDNIKNLQPLQRDANITKSDKIPRKR